jgi:acetyl esterase/lipase
MRDVESMRGGKGGRRGLGPVLAGGIVIAACSSAPQDGHAVGGPTDGGQAVAVTSRCPVDQLPATADDRSPRTAYDITYASPHGQPLRLDIAWPRTDGPHPLVILLHGGGWSGGSRTALRGEMLAFARRGYAAATVEYRLTRAPRDIFPAAVADARCAVRFLRARAATYDVAPERIAVAGYSAGAHLASMLGVAADVPGLDQQCPTAEGNASVQAVVSYAGPQDLRVRGPYTQEQARIVTNFLGVFPGDEPQTAALASPIAHVTPGDPPFLLIHGRNDDLVPVDHPRRMAAALRRAGTPATVLELPRTGHSFAGFGASGRANVRCTTLAFLAQWLGPPG